MRLIIVRPLEPCDTSQLGEMLSHAAKGTDYYFIVIPSRVDFEKSSKEQLQRLIDSIPDK